MAGPASVPSSAGDRLELGDASAIEMAVAAARAAQDKLATDVVVLDVASVLGICDHFVLATAQNERQVKAVVDAVEEVLRRDLGRKPRAEEGKGARRWVLLDYGDVVVHVFHADERAYYRLERLYGDVPRIPWRAEEVAGTERSDGAG